MSMLGKAVIKSSGVFVKLAGSDIETPARTTVEVEDGDTVLVNMENRKLVIIGNQTNIAGATVEGVTSNKNESGGNVSIDVGLASDKLGGLDVPSIKSKYTQSTLIIERTDVIAMFDDEDVAIYSRLVAANGILVNGLLAIETDEDGSLVIRDAVRAENRITFAEDGIHIDGDVYINGVKVESTEEEEGEEQ